VFPAGQERLAISLTTALGCLFGGSGPPGWATLPLFYSFISKEARPLLDGVLVFGSWSGRGKSSLPGCFGARRALDSESSSLN